MERLVYLYHHLPKCGGVSFIDTCSKWLPERRQQTDSYPTPEQTAEFARRRLDFNALPPNCFVHGHLVREGRRPFERYGDHIASGRRRLVTTVRDPLERHISAYYHRRKGRQGMAGAAGALARVRAQPDGEVPGCRREQLEGGLDAYLVVGTMEALQLTRSMSSQRRPAILVSKSPI
ncbi:MAG: sulfotransferase family 2 domain-containing protein [Pseudomonadota bacterium]|nr:sulfotransferase family 2 domain-containing protein [Pseudomonadota bacterium]